MDSMYYRYGGFKTINAVVLRFYDKILESPLGPLFRRIEMKRIMRHQVQFIAFLMDAPQYSVLSKQQLKRIHGGLDLGHQEFIRFVDIFCETLEEFSFDKADIAAMKERFHEYRPYVVKGD